MKTNEAKTKIFSIVEETFAKLKPDSDVPDTLLADLIAELVSECGDACNTPVTSKQADEINECLRNAMGTLREYEQTTQKITAMTEEEMPEISSLISSGKNDGIQTASQRLNDLQTKLKSELSRADETIKSFRARMDQMKRNSKIDKLTKVLNHTAYVTDMEPILRIGTERDLDLCMLMIEVSNLSEIHARHGKEASDKILIYVSRLLDTLIRQENRIYRFSENTFLIVLNRSQEEQLAKTEKRIVERLSKQRVVYGDKAIDLSIASGKSFHVKADTLESFTHRCFNDKTTILG